MKYLILLLLTACTTTSVVTQPPPPIVIPPPGITAASCNLPDVQAVVDAAKVDDVVLIPQGTCAWSAALKLVKGITLKGAGQDKTIITYAGTGHSLIAIAATSTDAMDISGMTLSGGDTGFYNGEHIEIGGPDLWKKLRVHHITFKDALNRSIDIFSGTDAVIDHCTFMGEGHGIEIFGRGDTDWNTPITFGSDDFLFIEDNLFLPNDSWGGVGHYAFDVMTGGRVVFRYNTLKYAFTETHDKARSGTPSAAAYEIYNNTAWSDTQKWEGFQLTAGTGVVYNNSVTGPYQVPFGGMDYKSDASLLPGYKNWQTGLPEALPCDGKDPLDGNWKLPDGTVDGYPCQYQIGTHGTPGASIVSAPVYLWGNTVGKVDKVNSTDAWVISLNGAGSPKLGITDGGNHVKEGRDFFNNTPKPGYVPFDYPHPLVK